MLCWVLLSEPSPLCILPPVTLRAALAARSYCLPLVYGEESELIWELICPGVRELDALSMAQGTPNSTLPPTPSPVGFHCGRGLPRCMLERGPLLLPPPPRSTCSWWNGRTCLRRWSIGASPRSMNSTWVPCVCGVGGKGRHHASPSSAFEDGN